MRLMDIANNALCITRWPFTDRPNSDRKRLSVRFYIARQLLFLDGLEAVGVDVRFLAEADDRIRGHNR